ncbi:MAG TPA: NUDIX hydrolase [Pseudonocardiaceae bacterium]|nr:NUDIX hydrolase [Pseudonocardiaceae bacterium]
MTVPHEFAVSSSDTRYVGRVLALRLDQVVMPGGRAAGREVVEHPGSVVILPLHDDASVVMIDQYRHPVGRRIRELPAGLLDAPGEDPVATARRELVEEVGYTAQDWSVLVDLVTSPGFSDEAVRVFLARGLTEVGRPAGSDDDEEADLDVVRLPLAEAVCQVLAGEIVNAPTVAGLLAAYAVLNGPVLTSPALADTAVLRPVGAPWPDRPTRFADRRGQGGPSR